VKAIVIANVSDQIQSFIAIAVVNDVAIAECQDGIHQLQKKSTGFNGFQVDILISIHFKTDATINAIPGIIYNE
jgi:hypothetical protein